MKNTILKTTLFALCPLFLVAQAPDTLWTKIYGGQDADYCLDGQQTFDGGYVFTGELYVAGQGWVGYLFKTDSVGDTVWVKLYDFAIGHSVVQRPDSGYIIAGVAPGADICLLKTDSHGDTLWTKKFGGNAWDFAWSVQLTSDEGYILAGETESFGAGNADVYVIKTDSMGDTLWTRTCGGTGADRAFSIQETRDGGYIVAGHTSSFGTRAFDVYVLKMDLDGDTLWTRTYGGSDHDRGRTVSQAFDGGYIIVGYTASYGAGGGDVWLIKTDSLGDTLWTRTYGGADGDEGYGLYCTSDGEVAIVGWTYSYGTGGADIYLVKVDSCGNALWSGTYGGSDTDLGLVVQETFDGGYILFGETRSFGAGNLDIYLIKINPFSLIFPNGGEMLLSDSIYTIRWFWEKPSGGVVYDIGLYLSVDGGNSYPYPITGVMNPDSNSLEWTVPQLNSTTCRVLIQIDSSGTMILEDESDSNFTISEARIEETATGDRVIPHLVIFSNPSKSGFKLYFQTPANEDAVLRIYNVFGRLVKDFTYLVDNICNQIAWDGCDNSGKQLPAGVYFLHVKQEDFSDVRKLVLLR